MQYSIFTIGHSTRADKEFIELLQHFKIELLADIRTIPRSRWNPQFNKGSLEHSIPAAGLKYIHIPELGGLREPRGNSIHLGLKEPGLRAYADHMQTPEFEAALSQILYIASKKRVALMCAEASFEKCHRRLTSDALLVRDAEVLHILSKEEVIPHVLTPTAKVDGTTILYPAPQSSLEF